MKNYGELIEVCKFHCWTLDIYDMGLPAELQEVVMKSTVKKVKKWLKQNGFTQNEFDLALHTLGLVDLSDEWGKKGAHSLF